MIVLDTNVISELVRDRPDPGVLAWVDARPVADLHLTSVTVAELLYGVERLPPGRRRAGLGAAVGDLVTVDFAGRVLPFDTAAAVAYAQVVAERDRAGRPIGMADAMIAAVALEAGAVLATRNVKDFAGVGIDLVDPWESRTP